MSDCCSLHVTLKAADLSRFLLSTDTNSDDWNHELDGRILMLDMDEANYGLTDGLETAATNGLEFHGYHSQGSEYLSEGFAAANGLIYFVAESSSGDYLLMAEFHNDNQRYQVSEASLTRLNNYRAVYKDVTTDFETLNRGV